MKKIINALKKAESIVLFPHIMLDGDCIGSCAALQKALRQIGKKCVIYIEDDVPEQYRFLLEPGDVVKYEEGSAPPPTPDLAVSIDSSDMGRLGRRGEYFCGAKHTACIDHHKSNNEFAELNYIRPERAATAELIFEFVSKLSGKPDKSIATCIYVGLLTDTGCFRFSNTTPESHMIAAKLIETGIDVAGITMKIFDEMPLRKLKLMGCAIDSLQMFLDGRLAVMSVTEADTARVGALQEDFNDIVNLARNISGVQAALLLRQNGEGRIKASLRTAENIDAAELAGKFAGGGHSRAAGFNFTGDFETLKVRVTEEVERLLAG